MGFFRKILNFFSGKPRKTFRPPFLSVPDKSQTTELPEKTSLKKEKIVRQCSKCGVTLKGALADACPTCDASALVVVPSKEHAKETFEHGKNRLVKKIKSKKRNKFGEPLFPCLICGRGLNALNSPCITCGKRFCSDHLPRNKHHCFERQEGELGYYTNTFEDKTRVFDMHRKGYLK